MLTVASDELSYSVLCNHSPSPDSVKSVLKSASSQGNIINQKQLQLQHRITIWLPCNLRL